MKYSAIFVIKSLMTGQKTYTGIFIVAMLALVCFANTLGGKFVYDDEFFVVNNTAIRDLRNAPAFFTDGNTAVKGGSIEGDVYRPLTTLSYSIDYFLWKLNPAGYHLTNLLFHIMNSVLLLLVINILTGNLTLSLLTALFFAAHPIQTDAITWISGRGNALFLFFYLGAFYLFIRCFGQDKKNTGKLYALSVICGALAMLSKEMAATLPIILLAYLVYFRNEQKLCWFKKLAYTMPFFMIDALYILARSAVLGKVSQRAFWGGSLYTTFLTMSKVFVVYLKLLLAPLKLCGDYVYPVAESIAEPGVLASLAILALLLVAAVKTYRTNKLVSFSIAWFFITLLPVSNIIPLKILVAERFLYLPSIGFCLALAWAVTEAFRRVKGAEANSAGLSKTRIFIAVLILVFYSGRTIIRNNDWKDDFTFWTSVIKVCPVNPKAHNNLGTHYSDLGQQENSEKEYRTAVQLSPNYVTPHFNLAGLYMRRQMYAEALQELETVLRLRPEFPGARQHYDEVARYMERKGIRP